MFHSQMQLSSLCKMVLLLFCPGFDPVIYFFWCIQILSCTGTFFAGYFCIALSKAVKGMRKGEKALLTVKPQCMCCFYFVVCICFVFISLLMLSLSFFNLQMHLERKEVLNMVFHQMLCFNLISS